MHQDCGYDRDFFRQVSPVKVQVERAVEQGPELQQQQQVLIEIPETGITNADNTTTDAAALDIEVSEQIKTADLIPVEDVFEKNNLRSMLNEVPFSGVASPDTNKSRSPGFEHAESLTSRPTARPGPWWTLKWLSCCGVDRSCLQ